MDPASAIVGLVAIGGSIVVKAHVFIGKMKDCPAQVRNIESDLGAVLVNLKKLEAAHTNPAGAGKFSLEGKKDDFRDVAKGLQTVFDALTTLIEGCNNKQDRKRDKFKGWGSRAKWAMEVMNEAGELGKQLSVHKSNLNNLLVFDLCENVAKVHHKVEQVSAQVDKVRTQAIDIHAEVTTSNVGLSHANQQLVRVCDTVTSTFSEVTSTNTGIHQANQRLDGVHDRVSNIHEGVTDANVGIVQVNQHLETANTGIICVQEKLEGFSEHTDNINMGIVRANSGIGHNSESLSTVIHHVGKIDHHVGKIGQGLVDLSFRVESIERNVVLALREDFEKNHRSPFYGIPADLGEPKKPLRLKHQRHRNPRMRPFKVSSNSGDLPKITGSSANFGACESSSWGHLCIVRNGSNSEVDIIAVHSLAVNSDYAWRYQVKHDGKPTGEVINWLKDDDMLPSEIPNARIMVFNYDSDLKVDAQNTQAWYHDFSLQLLRAIVSFRRETHEVDRPIIFVGAAIGGILIEQALVMSSTPKYASDYGNIQQCTVGVAFLGTPHHGTNAATLAAAVTRVSELSDMRKKKLLGEEGGGEMPPNDGADVLRHIVDKFMMWANRSSVDLTCFFETRRTHYSSSNFTGWSDIVVTEGSACLLGYPKVPLSTDHLGLTKYAGAADPSYRKVSAVLKEMALTATSKIEMRFNPRAYLQDNSRIPAIYLETQKALFVSWPNSDLKSLQRRIGERTPGTCEWLLLKQEFIGWLLGKGHQGLRLVGLPGSGKSMMFAFLVQQLTDKLKVTSNMTLAFHICDRRNTSSNTAAGIIRSILFQVFQQRPSGLAKLHKAYDIQGRKLFTDNYKMWEIMADVTQNDDTGELFLLIDGLDECDEASRHLLVTSLDMLVENGTDVHLFVTSRPEKDISRHLMTMMTISMLFSVEVDHDLGRYLDDRVPTICKRHGWSEKEEQTIKHALLQAADRNFLFCSLALHDIDKAKRKTQLQRLLDNLPRQVWDVYRRETDSIDDWEKPYAKLVLGILLAAHRPLNLQELGMAFFLARDSPDPWKDRRLPTPEELEKHDEILETCGRLLWMDEHTGTVQLAAPLIEEYLSAEYLLQDDLGNLASNAKETRLRLANILLEVTFRVLAMEDFDNIADKIVFYDNGDLVDDVVKGGTSVYDRGLGYFLRCWQLHVQHAEEAVFHSGSTKSLDCLVPYLQIRHQLRDSWLERCYYQSHTTLIVEWLVSIGARADKIKLHDPWDWERNSTTKIYSTVPRLRRKISQLLLKHGASLEEFKEMSEYRYNEWENRSDSQYIDCLENEPNSDLDDTEFVDCTEFLGDMEEKTEDDGVPTGAALSTEECDALAKGFVQSIADNPQLKQRLLELLQDSNVGSSQQPASTQPTTIGLRSRKNSSKPARKRRANEHGE